MSYHSTLSWMLLLLLRFVLFRIESIMSSQKEIIMNNWIYLRNIFCSSAKRWSSSGSGMEKRKPYLMLSNCWRHPKRMLLLEGTHTFHLYISTLSFSTISLIHYWNSIGEELKLNFFVFIPLNALPQFIHLQTEYNTSHTSTSFSSAHLSDGKCKRWQISLYQSFPQRNSRGGVVVDS